MSTVITVAVDLGPVASPPHSCLSFEYLHRPLPVDLTTLSAPTRSQTRTTQVKPRTYQGENTEKVCPVCLRVRDRFSPGLPPTRRRLSSRGRGRSAKSSGRSCGLTLTGRACLRGEDPRLGVYKRARLSDPLLSRRAHMGQARPVTGGGQSTTETGPTDGTQGSPAGRAGRHRPPFISLSEPDRAPGTGKADMSGGTSGCHSQG